MLTQAASLIVCLFLTQIVADTDVQFVMGRDPNNYFCGHLKCVSDITDSDNEVASFVDLTIYDITRVNSELKVASVYIFQRDPYVDTSRRSALSCIGVISRHQANLTVPLRHDIDCLYGVFKCQLNLVTVSGRLVEITEIVTPEHNHGFSRISDVSTRVDTQTAEIKRLADIVDNKLLPLIEQTAPLYNNSLRPGLMKRPEGKPELSENMSNQIDNIHDETSGDLSLTPTEESVFSTCYTGWTQYGNLCYFFSEKVLTWWNSFSVCISHGGRLAEIVSKDINDWVVEQLKARNITDAWVGGTKRFANTWEWVDSGRQIIDYTNWASGEPNYSDFEHCLQIWSLSLYQWNNAPCGYTYWFVCERRLLL